MAVVVCFNDRPSDNSRKRPNHDRKIEPYRSDDVEKERVFAEQVVELWNHGMVIGDGVGFELPQSALELCRVKFHCALLSIPSRVMRTIARCGASHLRWINATLGHHARPT